MKVPTTQTTAAHIEHHFATVNGVRLHYVISGQGPLVVLLHGMGGTWYVWRHVIPALARHYTVLAPDLRGFGDSDKPAAGYDKKTLAADIHALLGQLGHRSVFLVGHDFGGPVAYALAATHPDMVRRLAVFECLLLLPSETVSVPAWFVQFFQTPDIPEALLKGHEREFLALWRDQLTVKKAGITDDDLDEYARTYALPGAVRAGAELYRALPQDLEDNREMAKHKLPMPVLAFGADTVMQTGTLESFRVVASQVQGGVVPDCGHYVPEEQPAFVVEQLLSFFVGEAGPTGETKA